MFFHIIVYTGLLYNFVKLGTVPLPPTVKLELIMKKSMLLCVMFQFLHIKLIVAEIYLGMWNVESLIELSIPSLISIAGEVLMLMYTGKLSSTPAVLIEQ